MFQRESKEDRESRSPEELEGTKVVQLSLISNLPIQWNVSESGGLDTAVGRINCCVNAEAEEAEQWHPEEVQHQQAEDHIEC